ncbi:MAG: hypothetical protein JWO48_2112, partial [Bryobacterales bacterium]|nr:hypothetical protein [Bryobacterales bacterium]
MEKQNRKPVAFGLTVLGAVA